MAAPIVSGIAALTWGQMTPATARRDVETRILATSRPITGTGVDFRYGRVDACAAVTGNPLFSRRPPLPLQDRRRPPRPHRKPRNRRRP